jgi:hypothetical protein
VTEQEAREVVAFLTAAYPEAALEPLTVSVFAQVVATLPDAELAAKVALALIKEEPKFPSIAGFRSRYRYEDDRRKRDEDYQAKRALEIEQAVEQRELGRMPKIPDYVREWMIGNGMTPPTEGQVIIETGGPRPECDVCGDDGQVIVGKRRDRIRNLKTREMSVTDPIDEYGPCPACARGRALEFPEDSTGPWGPEGYWRGRDWRSILRVGG